MTPRRYLVLDLETVPDEELVTAVDGEPVSTYARLVEILAGRADRPVTLAVERRGEKGGATERLDHVRRLLPEICTLDCGTLNFGDGNSIVVQTPAQLREQVQNVE